MFRIAHLLFGARYPYGFVGGSGMYRSRWAERRAYRRAMRRRNPLRWMMGMLWLLFWIVFWTVGPLGFVLGGADFRHAVMDVVRSSADFAGSLVQFVVALFRDLFRSVA